MRSFMNSNSPLIRVLLCVIEASSVNIVVRKNTIKTYIAANKRESEDLRVLEEHCEIYPFKLTNNICDTLKRHHPFSLALNANSCLVLILYFQ